jgi:hypothetical protein
MMGFHIDDEVTQRLQTQAIVDHQRLVIHENAAVALAIEFTCIRTCQVINHVVAADQAHRTPLCHHRQGIQRGLLFKYLVHIVIAGLWADG